MEVPANPLLTDKGGTSQRLRVDNGSTGFFAGKEFRTFFEFSGLGSGASIYFKVSSPIDMIVQGLGIQVDDGEVKLEAFALPATVTGTWTVALPVFGANRMNARPNYLNTGLPYTSQVTLSGGAGAGGAPAATGQFTGGTKLDVLSVRTASSTAQASTQDAAVAGERGLPPGDVYLKITNIGGGSARGMMKARWEERP